MLLYFIKTETNQLVIAKSEKGVTKKNKVEKLNVRLKEMKNGDSVKQLLKLLVIAYNVNDVIVRHICLTHLYHKFYELDSDNIEVQEWFFNTWIKSLLKVVQLVSPECLNQGAFKCKPTKKGKETKKSILNGRRK